MYMREGRVFRGKGSDRDPLLLQPEAKLFADGATALTTARVGVGVGVHRILTLDRSAVSSGHRATSLWGRCNALT